MLVFLIGDGGGKYILVSPDAVNAPSEAEEYCIGLVPVIHEERTHLLFRGIQKFKRLIIVILFYDVKNILINPGFWLIALLCVLFYSCVFPFQKFASELMINKYGISDNLAGTIAGLPALGALILTPVFGIYLDCKGKGASIMMLGAAMLIGVHCIYALPFITNYLVAIILMIILGIAFSLVPSAMWPSVTKIFPARQLGTAYALIFFIQNIGLWGVPNLIGWVLDNYCIVGNENNANLYDYTIPMFVFTGFATLSFIVAYLLKVADKKYGYGLEKPNMKDC